MKTDTGELRDEDGLGLTLTKSSSGFTVKSSTRSYFTFNSLGNLTGMTDENGNTVTVTYKSDSSTISTISDETGYVITLTGEAGTDGNIYLKNASDNKGKTVTFYYSGSRLVSIISSDVRENASYTYDDYGNLTKLKCRDQSYTMISYTSAKTGYRVSSLEEYGSDGGRGQTVQFDRTKFLLTDITTSGKDSTIGTSDDVITQCQFDTAGRLMTCHARTAEEELGAYSQKLSSSSPDESGSDVKELNRYEKMANLSPTVDNMLSNHSGEGTTGWGHGSSVADAAFTFSCDDEVALFGTKSLKISATACDALGRSRFYQNISSAYIEPNTTYTASAYIRTSGVTEVSGQSDGGAAVLVYLKAASMPTDSDPEAADFVSEYVTGTTDVKVNDGWRRVSVTFTTPSDIQYVRFNGIIRGATGTAYFDGLQLEKGSTPSPYNMIENGDMEKVSDGMPEGWSTKNLSSSDSSVSASSRYGTYSFSISPDASAKKEIYQDVSVKGTEKDTYVLSGWSKGTGILERSTQSERKYKISVEIIYSDGTSVWKTPAEFTYAVGEWKYAATSFNLSDGTSEAKVPESIRVHVRAHGQANTVMFDGIQLVRKDIDQCTYDDDGNIKKYGKTSYTYTGENLLSTSTDSTGKTLSYQYYTGTSNIYKVTDSTSSAISTFSYDAYGNKTGEARKKSDGTMSIKTETLYDSSGTFVTSAKDENGYESTYAYNDRGYLSSYTDAKGTVTQYSYDTYDRITGVDEGNMGHTVSYNDRHLLSSIDAGNTVYSFSYDEFGNMTGVKIGAQSISSNTYAPYNGGLASSSTNNGVTCTYEYDDWGNLVMVRRNGTPVQQIIYGRDGNLHESRDYSSGLATRYRYDFDGNVTGTDVYQIEGEGLEDRWVYGAEAGYDTHGRVIRTAVHEGDRTYASDIEYTASGNVASGTYAGKTFQYSYDAIERQTKRRVVISESSQKYLDITYAYKDSERGTGYTTSQLEAERVGGVRYDYEYDRNGNITSIERSDSASDGTVIYTYDSNDQLIREDNQISGISTSYVYDTHGNLKARTENAYVNGVIGEVISTDAYNYGSVISGDRLTKINDEAVTYDGIGNPLNMEGWSLAWDGRRLISMTKGNDEISFGYDAEGRRTSKTVNGQTTEYFYIGDTVVGEESAANGRIDYIYDDAGRISALTRTYNGETETFHLLSNSRGDVEAIYNDDGTLIARYIYDAYGNEIKREYGESEFYRSMADINPFRYRGYMYDRETDLYYCSYRYYNPGIGRFISPDSTDYIDKTDAAKTNVYTYCANNPVNNTDPTGNAFLSTFLISIAIGIVGGAISGAVSAAMNGQDVAKGAAHGALWGGFQGAMGGVCSGLALNAKTIGKVCCAIGKAASAATLSACEEYDRQVMIEKRDTVDYGAVTLATCTALAGEAIGLGFEGIKSLHKINDNTIEDLTFNVITNPLTEILTFAGENDISRNNSQSKNKNNEEIDTYH